MALTPRAALALFLSTVMLTACGSEVGGAPERPRVDEAQGTYRGVGLEASAGEVIATFGKSPPLRNDPVIPLGSDLGELAIPWHPPCPAGPGRIRVLRYRWVSFGLLNNRVCEMIVAEDGAATQQDVAVGDSLDEAADAFPHFQCGDEYAGEGLFGNEATVPYCSGKVAEQRYLWFGGDPVNVIEMNTRPLKG